MYNLEFGNLVIANPKELNYTVRLGHKWKDQVRVGDSVRIVPAGKPDVVMMEATIQKIHVVRYFDIPHEVYQYEHNPECRTIPGLLREMCRVYPELANKTVFDLFDTVVTCLGFTINA